ncbi:MAG: hypothetical protein M1837_004626 [Sclerophora amabilis]|nr:MAG: hypothetical protein M1837_004626 [Sclerophora amabilis]
MLNALFDAKLSAVGFSLAIIVLGSFVWELLRYSGLDVEPPPLSKWILGIRRLIKGIPYLIHGPDVIERAYAKANGKPFVVQTETNQYVLVSSPEHIRELDQASGKELSLHAAAKELLQPKYTYTAHGFEWPDRRGVESVGFSRTLKTLLTTHLPFLLPTLRETMAQALAQQLQACETDDEGYKRFPVFSNVKQLVTIVNNGVFFGKEFSQNDEFTQAALEYMDLVPAAAELVKTVPDFIAPFLAKLITRGHKASNTLHRLLSPVVQKRLEIRAQQDKVSQADQPVDCIQWLIDTSPKKDPWTVTRAVDEIIAVWFSSVPQLAMTATYALHDLVAHSAHVPSLLSEVEGPSWGDFRTTTEGLPLLDNFIKESVRLSPIDSISCRRKALAPFTFSQGPSVPTGDWACLPQQAIWRDPQYFPNPQQFDPSRFARNTTETGDGGNGESPTTSKLTDVSETWLLWGYGRTACPGRFYATVIIKLLLSNIMMHYDCKLEDKAGKTNSKFFTWRSSIVPSANMVMLLKPREK